MKAGTGHFGHSNSKSVSFLVQLHIDSVNAVNSWSIFDKVKTAELPRLKQHNSSVLLWISKQKLAQLHIHKGVISVQNYV